MFTTQANVSHFILMTEDSFYSSIYSSFSILMTEDSFYSSGSILMTEYLYIPVFTPVRGCMAQWLRYLTADRRSWIQFPLRVEFFLATHGSFYGNTPPLISWVVETGYLAFLDKGEKQEWDLQVAHVKDTKAVGNQKEQASWPLPWQNSKVKIYPVVYSIILNYSPILLFYHCFSHGTPSNISTLES